MTDGVIDVQAHLVAVAARVKRAELPCLQSWGVEGPAEIVVRFFPRLDPKIEIDFEARRYD